MASECGKKGSKDKGATAPGDVLGLFHPVTAKWFREAFADMMMKARV